MIVKMGYDCCIYDICTSFLGEMVFHLRDSPDVEVHLSGDRADLFSIDKVASRTAPRFFTLGLGVTMASPIFMLISFRRHWLWELATTITSVFASFSLSLFTVIQVRTLAMQFSMVFT